MSQERRANRSDLIRIAGEVMAERGLEPEFPAAAQAQLATITGPGRDDDPRIRDLTALPWCSIDNDDSLDLDQLTACEPLADGAVKIFVAVADVDALVTKGSAIDAHALDQHHLGLHLGAGVSDAARAPVDRPDLAQPRRRTGSPS